MSQQHRADSGPKKAPDSNQIQGVRESITVPWRQVVTAGSVESAIATIRRYGWLPVVAGLLVHAVARGLFEYASDPFIIADGYIFDGWPVALSITMVEGFFLVLFAWFLYFGAVGAVAGFISSERIMAPEIFKIGGYLTVLFVPAFLVGSALIATVTLPETIVSASSERAGEAEFQREAYTAMYDTWQMQLLQLFKAAVWVFIGFLLLPVVSTLYSIDEKGSVAAVLPVTLVTVVAAFLV